MKALLTIVAFLLANECLARDRQDRETVYGRIEVEDSARAVAAVIPIVGFYSQPSVGGRELSYVFLRQFCEIENVVTLKIAPFDRYRTGDVVRAVADSGRDDIAPYSGESSAAFSATGPSVGDGGARFARPTLLFATGTTGAFPPVG